MAAPHSSIFWWVSRIAISTILLIFTALIWLYPAVQSSRRAASTLALEIADRVSAAISSYLNSALNDLQFAAEEIGIESEREVLVLERLLRKNTGFHSLSLVGLDGRERVRVDRFQLVSPDDFRDVSADASYQQARTGLPSIGTIFVSSAFEPRVNISVPIYHQGSVKGVLMAELNIRNLQDVLRTIKLPFGHIYVVDHAGFQVLHPDLSELLRRQNFASRRIVEKVVSEREIAEGLSFNDRYVNEAGETVFAVGRPIPGTGLGVFVEQPRSKALGTERQLIALAVVTIILGVLASVIIMRDRMRLELINRKLRAVIEDVDNGARMLVRRDLDLTQANMRLMEIDTVKSEFISIATHQLRTPLTSIKWVIHGIKQEEFGSLQEEQKKMLSEAFSMTNRLIGLVGDLLNVARLEEGRYGLRAEMLSIEKITASVCSELKLAADEHRVTLAQRLSPSLPETFPGDERSVSLILENLIENAIKYSKPGGAVEIVASGGDAGISISVKDSGIGISPMNQRRIFTKFFRAPNAQLFEPNGTGLGLYLTKALVERNGGTLTFESAEGEGTVFTCTLPPLPLSRDSRSS